MVFLSGYPVKYYSPSIVCAWCVCVYLTLLTRSYEYSVMNSLYWVARTCILFVPESVSSLQRMIEEHRDDWEWQVGDLEVFYTVVFDILQPSPSGHRATSDRVHCTVITIRSQSYKWQRVHCTVITIRSQTYKWQRVHCTVINIRS